MALLYLCFFFVLGVILDGFTDRFTDGMFH